MGVMPPIWRTRPATSEQALIAAILQRALRDIFAAPVDDLASGDGRPRQTQCDQAILFLTDAHGPKAKWRNTLCSFLDLDGEVLASRVRTMLDGNLEVPHPDDLSTDPAVRKRTIQRHAESVERARERWRDLKNRPVAKPNPIAVPEEPMPRPGPQARGDMVAQWLCFDIREDGTLYLPNGRPLIGLHDGLPLPHAASFQGRVLKALTALRGGTLLNLRKAHKNWEAHCRAVCRSYDLEVIFTRNGLLVDDFDGETKAWVRRIPPQKQSLNAA